jgi:hypothetical protein
VLHFDQAQAVESVLVASVAQVEGIPVTRQDKKGC